MLRSGLWHCHSDYCGHRFPGDLRLRSRYWQLRDGFGDDRGMSKTSRPSRRNVIDAALTSGVGLLLPTSLHGAATGRDSLLKVAGMPDVVAAFTEAGRTELARNGTAWRGQD